MSKTEGSDIIGMEFTYNHAGLRTKKVRKVSNVVTETTEYILNGKNVVELIHTDNTTGTTPTVNRLHFYYDAQGRVTLVDFNGTLYSYVHNLQGDIIGILDSSGNLVVEYRYDAWGKPISITGTLTTTLGELNPFRYRGYVWDRETELYYLRSRYYSILHDRFVTYDSAALHYLNAPYGYRYCSNSPVFRYDIDGNVDANCQDDDGIPEPLDKMEQGGGGLPPNYANGAISQAPTGGSKAFVDTTRSLLENEHGRVATETGGYDGYRVPAAQTGQPVMDSG